VVVVVVRGGGLKDRAGMLHPCCFLQRLLLLCCVSVSVWPVGPVVLGMC